MDLLQALSMRESVSDTNPPTMAQQFAQKRPNVTEKWDLADMFKQQQHARFKALMLIMKQHYPHLSPDQLAIKASGMLSNMDNKDFQNDIHEQQTHEMKGMTY